jgi:hypothetical protein
VVRRSCCPVERKRCRSCCAKVCCRQGGVLQVLSIFGELCRPCCCCPAAFVSCCPRSPSRVCAALLWKDRDFSSSTQISARQVCNSVHGFWRCKHAFPCASIKSLLVSRIAIAQRKFWISPPHTLLLVAKFTSVIGT